VAPGRGHIATYFGTGLLAQAIISFSMLYSALVVLTILLCVLHWRRLPAGLVVLLVLAGAVLISGGISTTDARFKAPAMPLLLVSSAWAIEEIRKGLLRRGRRG
jgi:predicted signal transduction protein with EAL and GGDEF domain